MIVQILENTPKWVFGLFVFLLVLGFQQSKDRSVKKYLILPLPVGMTFLSYFGLISSFGVLFTPIALWSIALLVVAFVIVKYIPVGNVAYCADTQSYKVGGSWVPLTLMMAIFFTKYMVGVLNALQPSIVLNPMFIILCSVIYGAFSGAFVARAISTWQSSKNKLIEKNA